MSLRSITQAALWVVIHRGLHHGEHGAQRQAPQWSGCVSIPQEGKTARAHVPLPLMQTSLTSLEIGKTDSLPLSCSDVIGQCLSNGP